MELSAINPLAPTGDPLAAADAILQSRRFKALDKYSRDEATKAIRLQALAMVDGLIRPTNERKPIDDDQWQSRVKKASEGGVRWDAKINAPPDFRPEPATHPEQSCPPAKTCSEDIPFVISAGDRFLPMG
jgi:hypothetical protein